MASLGRKLAPNATPMATARMPAKARYWPATTRLAEPCSSAPWAKNNDKTTMSSKVVTANNPAASAMRPELMGGRASGPGGGSSAVVMLVNSKLRESSGLAAGRWAVQREQGEEHHERLALPERQ